MSESSSTPRRGRFRFLYQFSLRTLLIVTAAAALFCNWYFQPKYHEEELAGKDLRVRQQMRLAKPEDNLPPFVYKAGVTKSFPPDPRVVNHGHWTLLDGDDFVVARGQFADGEESGNWVTYHPTGHKAAEGKMLHGVKVGRWRTWYEGGTLASEVMYADKPVAQLEIYHRQRPYVISAAWLPPPKTIVYPRDYLASSREGPAKAWHENGQLKFEGNYLANEQDGEWTFYDEQGVITATGAFRNGKRHGSWKITQARSASEGKARATKVVRFIDGRSEEDLTRLLARLEEQLASPRAYRRQQALIDLAEIGEGAVPVFARRLASSDEHELAEFLSVLPRLKVAAAPLLPRVRELSKSDQASLAHHARLALFQLDAASREALYDGLVAAAITSPSAAQCLHELVILYRSGPERQSAVFAELMTLPSKRSDVEDEQLNSALGELGGDVGPHILAAIRTPNPRVRLQGAKALVAVFRLWLPARTYVSFDKKEWETLLEALKDDPSLEVRALLEEIEQGPQFYGGVGGLGGGGGGGFF